MAFNFKDDGKKNLFFFFVSSIIGSNVLYFRTFLSHFHKLQSVSCTKNTKNMHILASGTELQAVRFGYVILGENGKKGANPY